MDTYLQEWHRFSRKYIYYYNGSFTHLYYSSHILLLGPTWYFIVGPSCFACVKCTTATWIFACCFYFHGEWQSCSLWISWEFTESHSDFSSPLLSKLHIKHTQRTSTFEFNFNISIIYTFKTFMGPSLAKLHIIYYLNVHVRFRVFYLIYTNVHM